MNARQLADQIIQRSRDIRLMAEHQEKHIVKAALTDITLDFAKQVADHLSQMLEQQWMLSVRKLRTVRDTRTLWRAVCRYVKATYEDHPINERHLAVVLAAYHWRVYSDYEKLFDVYFSPEHRRQLSMSSHGYTRNVVLEVINQYG